MTIYQQLLEKKAPLAVIGLGYVGLPLAKAFAQSLAVIGYDNDAVKISQLQAAQATNSDAHTLPGTAGSLLYTADPSLLQDARFFIIVVPTPIDKYNVPDLQPLLQASATVAAVLKKGDYVVYESTTYPGCTEEDCLPLLETVSRLKAGEDFKLGYSPERINPGDEKNTLATVTKVVSAIDATALEEIARVYELVVPAGVYRAPSIKVAEASKIVENVQRDLNIALMNELSMIFDHMGINTFDVLDAAATKWNFLPFQPGLVGGHCIGVDPYYLTHKASSLGYTSRVITASRAINDDMARYVSRKVITHVLRHATEPRVLVKGVTFKENVGDIRNSKIIDTVKELLAFNIQVDVEDPYAQPDEVAHEYGLQLAGSLRNDYDAVIITVPHTAYRTLTDDYFASITQPNAMIFDLKGIYKNKIVQRAYWSL
ncbi:MAG TPA: nucleotide sugar dehydrogenase [Chitinophagaceae bacterium]|nr:nucleotide sugar dehydrogenase [Chitinophagaceae bacterium]